jgi:MFS family permease
MIRSRLTPSADLSASQPACPQVATEVTATATKVQLSLTTFFVCMALGQLVGGPVSDQLSHAAHRSPHSC